MKLGPVIRASVTSPAVPICPQWSIPYPPLMKTMAPPEQATPRCRARKKAMKARRETAAQKPPQRAAQWVAQRAHPAMLHREQGHEQAAAWTRIGALKGR